MRPRRRGPHHDARRRPHQCRSPPPPAHSPRRPLSRACRRSPCRSLGAPCRGDRGRPAARSGCRRKPRDRGAGRGGRPAADRDARGNRARRVERSAPHRARSPARRIARAVRGRRAADDRDAAGAHGRAPPLHRRSSGRAARRAPHRRHRTAGLRRHAVRALRPHFPDCARRRSGLIGHGTRGAHRLWRGPSSAGVHGLRARPRLDGDNRPEASRGRRRRSGGGFPASREPHRRSRSIRYGLASVRHADGPRCSRRSWSSACSRS